MRPAHHGGVGWRFKDPRGGGCRDIPANAALVGSPAMMRRSFARSPQRVRCVSASCHDQRREPCGGAGLHAPAAPILSAFAVEQPVRKQMGMRRCRRWRMTRGRQASPAPERSDGRGWQPSVRRGHARESAGAGRARVVACGRGPTSGAALVPTNRWRSMRYDAKAAEPAQDQNSAFVSVR